MGMPIPDCTSGRHAHPSPVTQGSRISQWIDVTRGAAGE